MTDLVVGIGCCIGCLRETEEGERERERERERWDIIRAATNRR